jgi:glycosyltransferase involved in cell wall biosynthesis
MEAASRVSGGPRIVLGMPAYNRPDALPRALESLLSQTRGDFAVVIVDDKPTPDVRAVVDSYAASDPRIVYEPNTERLGMIGNWRKAFERARALYPDSEYFAWVSDHDMWHPRWLEVLSEALDAHPDAVLAFPLMQRVYPQRRRSVTRRFATLGVRSPLGRLRAAQTGMAAGNCIYGLFRATALARAGVFRPVLAPDRQVIVECLALGECLQVPEILWYREVAGEFSYGRQRRMFFPTHIPPHTYLPTTVQHAAVLFWDLAVRGSGRPVMGRAAGAVYAGAALWFESRRELLKPDAWWREMLRKTPLRPWISTRPGADDAADDDESPIADAPGPIA